MQNQKFNYKIKVLGCGGSNGVPSIESGYGDCDPFNTKNNRTRTSILIDIIKGSNKHSILIDVSPDFRHQALVNNVKQIDTILLTHHHADHIYGIHELRSINRLTGKSIDFYLNQNSLDAVSKAFYYLFNNKPALTTEGVFFKPDLNFKLLNDSTKELILRSDVGDIKINITNQLHGKINTLGFIINNEIGYIPDFSFISNEELLKYKNINYLFIATFLIKKHVAHCNLDQVCDIIRFLQPKHSFLVHMGDSLDYQATKDKLNGLALPSYDGLTLEIF